MTRRGDQTRAQLIEATLAVVAEVGYARASTRAIAERAGVAEGTIYRHFPDKTALFFAAALQPAGEVVDWVAGLPDLAGTGTVEANLAEALVRLARLQERVLPLEIAILADPEMAALRRAAMPADGGGPPGPPAAITAYLAAEQRLGRVRADVPAPEVAITLLAVLFGLAIGVDATGGQLDPGRIRSAVSMFVRGIGTTA